MWEFWRECAGLCENVCVLCGSVLVLRTRRWNASSFCRVVGPSHQINLQNPTSAWTRRVWKFLSAFFCFFFCFLLASLDFLFFLFSSRVIYLSTFICISGHVRDDGWFLLWVRCVCTCECVCTVCAQACACVLELMCLHGWTTVRWYVLITIEPTASL